MKLRLINDNDIKDVLKIYKPYVKNTPITFEYTVPSPKKFKKRVRKITEKFPWIVAEVDGEIVGYAYASPFRDRAAYAWDVESSIYIREDAQEQSIGKYLYTALEELLKLQGIYNIYAIITSTAKNSLSFHEAMGYAHQFTIDRCGWKFDQWYGITCMCKTLADDNYKPEDFLCIKDIERKSIENILKKYSRF